MICRRCRKKFDAGEGRVCPHCGEAYAGARSGVMKTSTILISAGETDAVYRSVKEVPQPLRRQLLKSTNGINAATILIADRRGREEIQRAIRDLPSSLQRRFLKPFREEEPEGLRAWLLRSRVKMAIASLLSAGSVLLVWFIFSHQWL